MDHKYFFCYNVKLSNYLATKGIKYITVARELKDNRIYSMYLQTPELSKAIQNYKQLKDN